LWTKHWPCSNVEAVWAYRTLKRQFTLDDAALEDLKVELIEAQRVAADEDGNVLVWTGGTASPPTPERTPRTYTPPYLAEKILTSRGALEGERKQVTVLFADLKGSMKLLADRNPEEARQLLDPALGRMMPAVHRSNGNADPFAGDGAEGCSHPWGGSGNAREFDGPGCTGG
jgi:class 3 adenylate cyclase